MSKRKFKGALIASSLLVFSAIAVGGLAACSPSETPVEELVYNSLAISNKTDLQAEWKVGDDDRDIAITATDKDDAAVNVSTAITNGDITITTSDATVISVLGKKLKINKAGTATITVAGGGKTDTVAITASPKDVIVYETFSALKTAALTEIAADSTTSTKKHSVKGVVVSNSMEGNIVISDGTDFLLVYGSFTGTDSISLAQAEVGKVIGVTGLITNYYGVIEFKECSAVLFDEKITAPALTAYDAAKFDAYYAHTEAYKSPANTVDEFIDPVSITATVKFIKSKTNDKTNLFVIEGAASTNNLLNIAHSTDAMLAIWNNCADGASYTIKGTITGYNSGNKYFNMIANSVEVVVVDVDTITITAPSKTSFDINEFEQLKYSIGPAEAAGNPVTWTSSAPEVASVSETGMLKALSAGTTNITITSNGVTSEAVAITVTSVVATATTSVDTITNGTVTISPAAGTNLPVAIVEVKATANSGYRLKQVYVKIDGGDKTVINEKDGKYIYQTEKGKSYVFGADFKSVVASFAEIIAEDPEDETQVGFEGKLIAVSDLGNQMDGAIFYDGENYGFVKQGNKGNTKYPPAAVITNKTIGNNYKVMATYNNESRGHYINVDSYASLDCSITDSTKTIAAPTDTAVAWGETELAAFGNGDVAKHVSIENAVVNVDKANISFSVGSYTKGAISNASDVTFKDGHKYTLKGYAAANYNGKTYFVITGATDTTPALTGITCVAEKTTLKIKETTELSATALPEFAVLPSDVKYEVTEGSEFVTLDGSKITGKAAGTAKIVAKVGDFTSAAISITVTSEVLAAPVASYSFANNGSTTKTIDEAAVKALFAKGLATGGTDIVTSVDTAINVYGIYSAEYAGYGMKFGASQKTGELSFKINDSTVTNMKITGIGWTASDKISVGTTEFTSSHKYTEVTADKLEEYEFALSNPTSITIKTNERFFIKSIEFLK